MLRPPLHRHNRASCGWQRRTVPVSGVQVRGLTASDALALAQDGDTDTGTGTDTDTDVGTDTDADSDSDSDSDSDTELAALGSSQANPGIDCQDILDDHSTVVSGAYWLQPGASAAVLAYCEQYTGSRRPHAA
jgi:hypothetical protein